MIVTSKGHAFKIKKCKFSDLPQCIRSGDHARDYKTHYEVRLQVGGEDGPVVFYLAKGYHQAPRECVGFYLNGKFWESCANSLSKALEGLMDDAWRYIGKVETQDEPVEESAIDTDAEKTPPMPKFKTYSALYITEEKPRRIVYQGTKVNDFLETIYPYTVDRHVTNKELAHVDISLGYDVDEVCDYVAAQLGVKS